MQMNQVGLREVVKSEDDRRFEVTVTSKRGRAVEVWTMQAATRQLKAEWVARIKKLLMKQFFSIRRMYRQKHPGCGPPQVRYISSSLCKTPVTLIISNEN